MKPLTVLAPSKLIFVQKRVDFVTMYMIDLVPVLIGVNIGGGGRGLASIPPPVVLLHEKLW